MEIRSLGNIDFDTLFEAFESAFGDYAVKFEKEEVRAMLVRRGFNPNLSFGAFDGDRLVAFIFNGTGMFEGGPTAYDTGTGTVSGYRGRGLAKEIFSYALPYLREAGIRQYVLEVLQDNERAISVYRAAGLGVRRELKCFRQEKAKVAVSRFADESVTVKVIGTDEVLRHRDFCDFEPSWQNSGESIVRAGDSVVCIGAYSAGELAGYCVFDPATGDLTQLAVSRQHRNRGIGSRLLAEAVAGIKCEGIKVLNVCESDTSLSKFLISHNIPESLCQYEMSMQI